MTSYANGTTVSVAKSIAELDALVTKYGATGFAYGREGDRTVVGFTSADRLIRFEVTRPPDAEFKVPPRGVWRTATAMTEAADAEHRRRWRALLLVVKALLVAVEDKVISQHDAFLPYTVLPGGQTVGGWAEEQLDAVYAGGQLPALMPAAGRAVRGGQ